ncbi:plasmid stabilization protein [Seleniivibrio sp.]|uniref:type II toxin-antitoxin system RelE/ParE family toxin n=1 Tax=Seleniivibrio sp. TaxID=2898801 RepID=UPI0025F12125|nr:plasmid stabilization protein [Seleniivibrio sp.]MCD8554919.1 plasmid stabilization protein [Seleniivibrio sp.]
MIYKIFYSDEYEKKASKFIKKHPELREQYLKTLKLLSLDPYYNSLRLHKLKVGKRELYSVSINIQYRITMEFYVSEYEIVLIDVSTHDSVYR